MPASPSDIENFHLQIQRRLVESGEWEKLMNNFIAKVSESGWLDEMLQKGKNVAQDLDQLQFEAVQSALARDAHRNVPLPIRRELLNTIRQYLEKQFE